MSHRTKEEHGRKLQRRSEKTGIDREGWLIDDTKNENFKEEEITEQVKVLTTKPHASEL